MQQNIICATIIISVALGAGVGVKVISLLRMEFRTYGVTFRHNVMKICQFV
jgi:hypothetical protein